MRKRDRNGLRISTWILDLFYPAVCDLCQSSLTRGRSLCGDCRDELPRITPPFCEKCGEVFDGNIEESFRCQNCHGLKFDFDFARAALKGLALSFHLVHGLKYQRQFYLASELAGFLHEALEEDPRLAKFNDALLIPVPLYWKRQQWRQGNQAYELSQELTRLTGLETIEAIKRIRSTNTQTKLNRKQRLSNLRGAFKIRKKCAPKIIGKKALIIDDVFTTGATAHECAKILKKEGGVTEVAVLTLLRG